MIADLRPNQIGATRRTMIETRFRAPSTKNFTLCPNIRAVLRIRRGASFKVAAVSRLCASREAPFLRVLTLAKTLEESYGYCYANPLPSFSSCHNLFLSVVVRFPYVSYFFPLFLFFHRFFCNFSPSIRAPKFRTFARRKPGFAKIAKRRRALIVRAFKLPFENLLRKIFRPRSQLV